MQQRLNEAERAPVITRPPHYPTPHTRETVRHLVAFGLDPSQISYIIRCLPSEIEQHYADEVEMGLARINAQVQSVVLHKALIDHDVQAAKLWLINKAGWKAGDANKLGIAVGYNGQPVAPGEGSITVTERHTKIETMLRVVASAKRQQGPVTIQGESHEVKANGHDIGRSSNGAGPVQTGPRAVNKPRQPSVLRKPPIDPGPGRVPGGLEKARNVARPAGKIGREEDRVGNAPDPVASVKKTNGSNGNGGTNGSGGSHHR